MENIRKNKLQLGGILLGILGFLSINFKTYSLFFISIGGLLCLTSDIDKIIFKKEPRALFSLNFYIVALLLQDWTLLYIFVIALNLFELIFVKIIFKNHLIPLQKNLRNIYIGILNWSFKHQKIHLGLGLGVFIFSIKLFQLDYTLFTYISAIFLTWWISLMIINNTRWFKKRIYPLCPECETGILRRRILEEDKEKYMEFYCDKCSYVSEKNTVNLEKD